MFQVLFFFFLIHHLNTYKKLDNYQQNILHCGPGGSYHNLYDTVQCTKSMA